MREYQQEYLDEVRPEITYANTLSSHQLIDILKLVVQYALLLFGWLYVVSLYGPFGKIVLVPSVTAMSFLGAFTAWYLPEEKENTASETKNAIYGYIMFLLLYRGVIQLAAPISSAEMSVALNITMPAVSGMAAVGLFQNILILVAFLTPIGFLIFLAGKYKIYMGGKTKHDAFQRLKGIRENKKRY